jgi:hypothetical protein
MADKIFYCNVSGCSRVLPFDKREKLSRHHRDVHDRRVVCPKCEKRFGRQSHLRDHTAKGCAARDPTVGGGSLPDPQQQEPNSAPLATQSSATAPKNEGKSSGAATPRGRPQKRGRGNHPYRCEPSVYRLLAEKADQLAAAEREIAALKRLLGRPKANRPRPPPATSAVATNAAGTEQGLVSHQSVATIMAESSAASSLLSLTPLENAACTEQGLVSHQSVATIMAESSAASSLLCLTPLEQAAIDEMLDLKDMDMTTD